MSDAGTRRLTARGARTRERIIAAAAELVFDQGTSATTLDQVRAAAGVSSSQLYHYFTGKADLLQAVVARHTDTVVGRQEPLLHGMTTLSELDEWCRFVIESERTIGARRGCPIGSLGSEIARQDEAAREAISRSLGRWDAALTVGLTRLRDRGVLRDDADPAALASYLLATLQGGLLLDKVHRDDRPLEVALTTAVAHVTSLAA